jgi:hypothetical protein
MQDYQGNSDKEKKEAKELPEKNLDKVVTGTVSMKPKTLTTRFKSIFLGGDFTTAAQYVASEVLLPALRNLVVDAVSKGTDRVIYGDSNLRRRPPTNYSPRIRYDNPINRGMTSQRAYLPDQRPAGWAGQSRKTFEDVIVASKADADGVVERLTDIVDIYEVVSVADLSELLGLPSTHIDNKWGWTQLAALEVRQVREGWRISFPPLEEIS